MALPLATPLFLSFCPSPSTCLYPGVHPISPHLEGCLQGPLTLWLPFSQWLEEGLPCISQLP